MALFVYTYAIHSDLNGPVLGGLTFLTGMTIELITNAIFLFKAPQWEVKIGTHLLSLKAIWKYTLPLVFSLYLTKMMTPITFNIIEKTANSEEALGGFQLYHSTMWIALSLIFSAQPMIIKYATTRKNLKRIFAFNLGISVLITLLLTVLTYTYLKDLFYIDFMKVDNELILELLYESLPFTLVLPLLSLTTLFLNALHTRSGHTMWLVTSNVIALIPVFLIRYLDLADSNGTLISVVCYIIFYITTIVIQLIGLRKYGLDKCFTENITSHKKHT
jgi:hypothetical protein